LAAVVFLVALNLSGAVVPSPAPVRVSAPVPMPPPQQIVVQPAPAVTAQIPPTSPLPTKNYQTVRVEPDDTLRAIVRRYLSRELDPQLTREILQLNPGIDDPDLILAGARLRLPVKPGIPPEERSDGKVMP
jgi:phage tail protein X